MRAFFLALLISASLTEAQTMLQFLNFGESQRICCTAADAAGNVYIAGDFLDVGSGVETPHRKAVVVKLGRNNQTIYSFVFPGQQSPQTIAVNAQGEVFVAGEAAAADFPAVNPLPAPAASSYGNAFISKLNADGTALLSSSLVGSTRFYAIALDADGNPIVGGSTTASDYPVTPNAFQISPPRYDGFGTPSYAVISRISADGRSWLQSTFLGDSHTSCSGGSVCIGRYGSTAVVSLAVDASGAVQIAGNTTTDKLPTTPGAAQSSVRSVVDVMGGPAIAPAVGFLTRFKPDLSALEWSNCFGNQSRVISSALGDTIGAMTLATDGTVYLVGSAVSGGFPVTDQAYSNTRPFSQYPETRRWAYSARFTTKGALLFSTYLAGPLDPHSVAGITWDKRGRFWTAVPILSGTGSLINPPTVVLLELSLDGDHALSRRELPSGTTDAGLIVDSMGRVVVSGNTASSVLRIDPQQSQPAIHAQVNIAWAEATKEVAPGEIVRLYGSFGRSDVQVTFDRTAAPLLYADEGRIEAIIPFDVAFKRSVRLQVLDSTGSSNPVDLSVAPTAPQIIANSDGSAAALNGDGTVNSSTNPALPGSIAALFVNGAGVFEPAAQDGAVFGEPLPRLAVPVSATCGSESVSVAYAGAAPGMIAGLSQINIRLASQGTGTTTCSVTIGGRTSRARPVWVRR